MLMRKIASNIVIALITLCFVNIGSFADDVSKGSMWSTILLPELIIGRQTKNYILEKYKNRIREKAIEVAKEKLKYQKKKPSEIPEDQLEGWVMDAEKKIKSKDKWLLLKIILLPTGVSLLPWL